MNGTFFLTSVVAATMFLANGFAQEAAKLDTRVLLNLEPDKENPRNSEGDFVALSDGSIAFVYTRFTGGGSDFAAADLCLRSTSDRGATWTDDRVLVPNEGGNNVMSVSLLRLGSGEILLFYLRKNSLTDCLLLVRRSTDDLKTLSEPVLATPAPGYHVVNNDRVVQLSTGRLIIPAALHANKPGSESFNSFGIPRAFFSDDNGVTWRLDATHVDPVPTFKIRYQEPGIVERKDGSIWMYIRTDGGSQFGSVSTDGGMHWSTPEPTVLKSPVSPATIERIPGSDRLVCVWNDHSGLHPYPKGKRTPLCVAVSDDEGKTWSKSRAIETAADGWYCYTAMEFVGDELWLAYCAGDSKVGGLNRLRITALRTAELLAE